LYINTHMYTAILTHMHAVTISMTLTHTSFQYP